MSNIQPPVPMRDLAAFLSYLAHCSAGGTSHNSGTCTAVTGSANTPGNPHQIVLVGSSAGGMYTQLLLQSGCVNGSMCPFLDNNITDLGKGYTPWSDTGWNNDNQYGNDNPGV